MYLISNLFFRWKAISIHGDKSQQERDYALRRMFCIIIVHLETCFVFYFMFMYFFYRVQRRSSPNINSNRCGITWSRLVHRGGTLERTQGCLLRGEGNIVVIRYSLLVFLSCFSH